VYAPRVFKGFSLPNRILSIYLLLRNYFPILKMPTETLLRIPLSVIGRYSLMPTSHWMEGKYARINLSQAAFDIIYGITGGFLYAFSV
jgi:hypothetical protein